MVISEPAPVSILRQGAYLIASVHTALDDTQMARFGRDLVEAAGPSSCTGVIIDVTALDVLDSFGFTTIRSIGDMVRLRGATTVIVGIQPEVALAVARLGTRADAFATALDLDQGLALLDAIPAR